jgi:hypothetical protein
MAESQSTVTHKDNPDSRRTRGHYSEEMKAAVAADYAGGAFLETISAKHRIRDGTIKRILAERGVPLRVRTLREDYFDTWTPNSAWLVGYTWADGSVGFGARGNSRISFCCADTDAAIMHDIRRELAAENPVTTVESKPNAMVKNARPQARFRVNSPRLVASLIRIGVVPNKSNTDPPMPDVPDEYFNHFARGVLDGDGSIVVTRNHKHLVQFVGSHKFMAEFCRRACRLFGVTERQPRPDSASAKISRGVWGAKADALKLLRGMYPAGDYLALARKRAKAEFILATYGQS